MLINTYEMFGKSNSLYIVSDLKKNIPYLKQIIFCK